MGAEGAAVREVAVSGGRVTKGGEISQVWVWVWGGERGLETVHSGSTHMQSHGPVLHKTHTHAYVQRKSDILLRVSNCY